MAETPPRGSDGKFLPKSSDERIAEAKGEAPVDTIDVDARIQELEALVAERDAQIADLKPERPIASFLFRTREDVIAHFGERVIDEKVADLIASENRERARKGYDRIKYGKKETEAKRNEFIDGLLADRDASQPPLEGWLDRTLKMLKPDNTLVQIPYEGQINNVAGSLADGYVRYERKGYKRTEPMLCPTKDCWKESAMQGNVFTISGYCSQDHFDRTEKGQVDGLVK